MSSPKKRTQLNITTESASSGIPTTPKKRARVSKETIPATPNPAPSVQSANIPHDAAASLLPDELVEDGHDLVVRPELSFDYEEAQRHLINADARFEALFETMKCKPFEEDSDLNPFRALCCSILGQQVRKDHSQVTSAELSAKPPLGFF